MLSTMTCNCVPIPENVLSTIIRLSVDRNDLGFPCNTSAPRLFPILRHGFVRHRQCLQRKTLPTQCFHLSCVVFTLLQWVFVVQEPNFIVPINRSDAVATIFYRLLLACEHRCRTMVTASIGAYGVVGSINVCFARGIDGFPNPFGIGDGGIAATCQSQVCTGRPNVLYFSGP